MGSVKQTMLEEADAAELRNMVNELYPEVMQGCLDGFFTEKDWNFIEDMHALDDVNTATPKQKDYIRSLWDTLTTRALPFREAMERD